LITLAEVKAKSPMVKRGNHGGAGQNQNSFGYGVVPGGRGATLYSNIY